MTKDYVPDTGLDSSAVSMSKKSEIILFTVYSDWLMRSKAPKKETFSAGKIYKRYEQNYSF